MISGGAWMATISKSSQAGRCRLMATAPTSSTPGELLDHLLQGAREVLVEGARLHLDEAAKGSQGRARLDLHAASVPPRGLPRLGRAAEPAREGQRNVTTTGAGGNCGRRDACSL